MTDTAGKSDSLLIRSMPFIFLLVWPTGLNAQFHLILATAAFMASAVGQEQIPLMA